jgi:hypothetical protein
MGGAELACHYVAERVQRIAGKRWLQGPRKDGLPAPEGAPEIVRQVAARELFGLPPAAPRALVAWAAGRRPVELRFDVPTPREVLAMQARGRRVVSLLDDTGAPAGPKASYGGHGAAPGLGFVVHDLCHLEKFVDPAHHLGQVGFFAALDRALSEGAFTRIEAGFDAAWIDERDHVLADMNGSAVFLYVVLRNKVKLAVRRRVAAERGEPMRMGPLDDGEARAYDEAVEALLDAFELDEAARAAARRLDAKRADEAALAATLVKSFEDRGRLVLTSASPAQQRAAAG